MKKLILALFIVLAPLTVPAAFIDFDRSVTYAPVPPSTVSDPIPAAKIPTIQYQGWYGPSPTGPWTAGNSVTDNLALAAPDPAAGSTLGYTVDATLDGMTSEKAVAASKSVPFARPAVPSLRGVR